MDKYGVELDTPLEKTGSVQKKCPKCGADLPDPSTPYCNNCGTEPWEKKPEAPKR